MSSDPPHEDQPHQPDQPHDQAPDPQLRVTAIELFFDLVFAFTLTQLTVVLEPRLTAFRVVQVLLIFGLLWWMYGGYAWLTNSRPPVKPAERLLLLLGMAGFLIVGLAIPRSFEHSDHAVTATHDGFALGLGYLLVVCVHSGLYARVNQNIWRLAPFNLASAVLVVVAGLTTGFTTYVLWLAALVIQAGSPLVVKLGGRFDIRPAHFAERHGALIIVAIGESIAAIGIGAARLPVTPSLALAAIAGLALSAALWWEYFGYGDDEAAQHAMSQAPSSRRPGLALSGYFYAHIPMLLGVVFLAAGISAATGHGGAPGLRGGLALSIGAAAFAGGTAAFRAAMKTGPITPRLVSAVFALATIPLGAYVSIKAQLLVLTAGLIALLLVERKSRRATPTPAAS